jgi:hypothetical protein
MKNQIIGTDVSLEVCKNEGYLMVKTDGIFSPDVQYNVFAYFPDYMFSETNNLIEDGDKSTDEFISLVELLELYAKHKESIDKFCGDSYSLNASDYNYGSFLSLADVVNVYCGLN